MRRPGSHLPLALTALLLLVTPAAAQPEIWRLVRTESPAIEWDYADGRFTRDATTAHYIREPNGEHFDLRFFWRVPQELTAGIAQEVELTADVIAGWDCRPFFLGARVFISQNPCAFCVDGREVGAGICDEHDEGVRSFRIEPGNFGQPEVRLHVQATDGSLFSATVITYVYARGAAVATATETPPPTPTHTSAPTPTPTVAANEIACGETVNGALSDGDPDLFDDGTFADAYFFTLTRATTVRFSLTATAGGFAPYVWIGDLSNPNDWEPIFQGGSPQEGQLAADRYVVIANNTSPIAPGSYPYTLQLDCDGQPTPTHTIARTPTRRVTPTDTVMPTPTATPTAAGDLVADYLEVVQTIQDLTNGVPLVAGKRTVVRFHVHADAGRHRTDALLRVERDDGDNALLKPINGLITVWETPLREERDDAFLFELPTRFTHGALTLEAELNPRNAPRETDRHNNGLSTTVTFTPRPSIHLVVYRVGYDQGGTRHLAAEHDVDALLDWIERAYPLAEVSAELRTYHHATSDGPPWCVSVNAVLVVKRTWDDLTGNIPPRTRYYGMVDAGGGFMRGCSAGILAWAASGPTGVTPAGHWDTDGTYGDWYGAHEIGHAWGQAHTGWCGDVNPLSGYPYADARISPTLDGVSAVYGFDVGTRAIYDPTWTDLMSYCDRIWISDYAYRNLSEAIDLNVLDILDGRADLVVGPPLAAQWLVVGGIDDDRGTVDLQPLFVIPDAPLADEPTTGDHAVVLRAGNGSELGRHRFALTEIDEGPPAPGDPAPPRRRLGHFSVLVPYVEGIARIDIEAPDGIVHSVRAGLAAPTVTLLSPNGGEQLDGTTVPLSWVANDSDGDPLTFNVQYSADDGVSWEMVAQNLSGDRATIDAQNIRAGGAARFRIWASDGIHSSSDTSDEPFSVANAAPAVRIVSPANGVTVAAGQTVALVARAYDLDAGLLAGAQLEWRSDRDGALGAGRRLAIADLSVGRHAITVRADDGDGGIASAGVAVNVVSDISKLCAGDCSGDGTVTVDELVAGVGVALGNRGVDICPAFDADDDGAVTVSELIAAVNAALGGC